MSEIKSDVKETVKAFIQTFISIIVKEITKKMIKGLNYLQKKNLEAKIKNMSEEQLAQFLDENPCFIRALENALKSLDYAKSAGESISLVEKLESIFENTSAKDLVGAFIWPAPRMMLAVTVAIVLLATIAVPSVYTNYFGNNTTNNITNNTSQNVTIVTNFPVANFSTNVTKGPAPLTVQFSDLSENSTGRNWDFGDGSNSTEQKTIHTYYLKGNYTVNLIAINGNNTSSTNATITVLDQKLKKKLELNGSMGPGSSGTDSSGSSEGSTPPSENLTPIANFNANVTAGYPPLSVQFSDSSQGATSWNWNFGDGQTSTAQNPINKYYSIGTYTVSLNASNANGFNISTKPNLITVGKTIPLITWNNPADITYGTALNGTQLNAIITGIDGKQLLGKTNYTPVPGVLMNAGTGQNLHVDFTPTDTANYTNATADVTINVQKATPTIVWNNPADIIYPTALGDAQLNAKFNSINGNSLPGNPIYLPAPGVVMNIGLGQNLHVDFTPTDTTNYSSTSKDVTINVISSTNNNLSALTISSGTLTPIFSSSNTIYTDSVSYTTSSVTVTPTVADSSATITVNGNAVTSGLSSQPINLNVGTNNINILVTAQNGDTKNYIISITRSAASTNNNLSVLKISSGSLIPDKFSSGTTIYKATVANSVSSVTVTPTTEDSTATVAVNGIAVTSGQPSQKIDLNVGTNNINILVTAQNGAIKTYTITVTRAGEPILSDLTISSGTLTPKFSSNTLSYTDSVSYSTKNVAVTPTTTDSTATITVNGTVVISGHASQAINLSEGINTIKVVVTSYDSATKTYTIIVYRPLG